MTGTMTRDKLNQHRYSDSVNINRTGNAFFFPRAVYG